MPESLSHASTHVDRVHHHRARVAAARAEFATALADTANGYDQTDRTNQTATGPLGAEDGAQHE